MRKAFEAPAYPSSESMWTAWSTTTLFERGISIFLFDPSPKIRCRKGPTKRIEPMLS